MNRPILLLDFDGVCHSYISGWKGADIIPDPPVDGMWEFLEEALFYFDVQIYSSRSSHPRGIIAMKEWFDYWYNEWKDKDIPRTKLHYQLKFPEQKPPAFLTIDDRAITFTGEWPQIQDLLNFKPWNK